MNAVKVKACWIISTCDFCRSPGLHVLVPETENGLKGVEFPSLCPSCARDPIKRGDIEQRALNDGLAEIRLVPTGTNPT